MIIPGSGKEPTGSRDDKYFYSLLQLFYADLGHNFNAPSPFVSTTLLGCGLQICPSLSLKQFPNLARELDHFVFTRHKNNKSIFCYVTQCAYYKDANMTHAVLG